MADFIDLAKPLKLATPGTAPIAGLTVADTAALEAIDSPWLGMVVYVEADGKTYRITELKDVSLGAFTKKAVSKYETVPDKTDLDGKAPADHQHTLSDLSDLSELENQFAAKEHDHDGTYAPADHQHTLSDLSDLSELENQFAAADHTHNYNELTGVPAPTSGITLGIIKSYDPETGTVTVQEANDDWTENPEGTIHENVIVP